MNELLIDPTAEREQFCVRNECFQLKSPALMATVDVSRFTPPGGVEEVHLLIHPDRGATAEEQLKDISEAYQTALKELGLCEESAVLRRWYCSDLVNQSALLEASALGRRGGGESACGVSWVGQPAVPDSKFSLWSYHIKDPKGSLLKQRSADAVSLQRGDLTHHWSMGLACPEMDGSAAQTGRIFDRYTKWLASEGMKLADEVIRTWLYVQDIDTNYSGLVASRRKFFKQHGLTPDSHYIASSGIEGRSEDCRSLVAMDAYAIGGVRRDQICYLNALDHLGPTEMYGVTFERATAVSYRDRRHIFLSGTASIDPQGEILHPGNVRMQLDRTLDNMEALLADGGGSLADMNQFTVYLRDPCDHALARGVMRERFGHVPLVVVVGPVCRPGWLIELEGMATVSHCAPALPEF